MATWRPAPAQMGASGWPPGCRWRRTSDEHPGGRGRPADPGPDRVPAAGRFRPDHAWDLWSITHRPVVGVEGGRTSVEDMRGHLWVYEGLSPVGGCGGRSVAVASGHGQGRPVVAAAAR